MGVRKVVHIRMGSRVRAQDVVQDTDMVVAQILGRLYILPYLTEVVTDLRHGKSDANTQWTPPDLVRLV